MKKKQTDKPLRLTAEKVRELQQGKLEHVAGGRKVKPTCVADPGTLDCI